ncbi:MAG: DUF1559 domain-containing protein [Planctomycetaceae bacterium]
MSSRQMRFSWGLLAAVLGIGLTLSFAATQNEPSRPVEELLPADTVLLLGHDGAERHQAAWEKTAAYESMYESGMMDVWEKLIDFVGQQAGMGANSDVDQAMKHLEARGATLAVSLPSAQGPPLPHAMLVLHDAAKFESMLTGLARNLGGSIRAQFESKSVSGRSVTMAVIPDSPGVEIGVWAEGGHLVVVAGIDAISTAISVADGKTPNLKSNELWRKYNYGTDSFETTSVAWLDFAAVRSAYGAMPLPTPGGKTIDDILQTAGLHNLTSAAYQYGYRHRSLWSQVAIEVDGPRTGLLALSDQKAMTLADLPPLPANTSGFNASRLDMASLWNIVTQLIREGAAFGPPGAAEQVDGVLSNLPQMIGFDPGRDLFAALGDIVCIYSDPDQGFLGTGMGVMLQVRDANTLTETINKLLLQAEQASRGDFRVHRSEKSGRELVLMQFGDVQAGALCIDNGWLIAGLMPQSVEAALMRIDGKLTSWKPTAEQAEAFETLPKSFTSITVGDPRVSWHTLMKLAPFFLSGGQAALKEERILPRDAELPITIADLPPAELIVRPLFPNVTVTTSDSDGIHITSRQSLPGIPFIGSIGEGSGLATAAIGTALLLPAIQQAREAARRTQSRNNLKQIALALHNYHDVYGSFPSGTHPNEKLKPEERISWLAAILPFLEQQPLYQTIDFEESWDDASNERGAMTRVPSYLNPGSVAAVVGPGETHYVGIAGVGKDAPMLPVTSKRAGVFGYNRKTRIRDITDGTSNTIMTSEASGDFGPWMAGGNASIRSLTTKPYINGPDGIGGPYRGGVNVGLADGSVRFVSENIDPRVFELLSAMADGEVIPQF